jgi:hypothetical protein
VWLLGQGQRFARRETLSEFLLSFCEPQTRSNDLLKLEIEHRPPQA